MKNSTILIPTVTNNVTLRLLSQKLDLSITTISRALNDNPKVRLETKKRVLEKATEMNYTPNEVALSLKNKKTKRIGLIFQEEFPSDILIQVSRAVFKYNYWPVLGTQENISDLMRNGIDGLIFLGSYELSDQLTLPFIHLKASSAHLFRSRVTHLIEQLITSKSS